MEKQDNIFNLNFNSCLIEFFRDCIKYKKNAFQSALNKIEKQIMLYYKIQAKDLLKIMSYLYSLYYEDKEEFKREVTKIKDFIKSRI